MDDYLEKHTYKQCRKKTSLSALQIVSLFGIGLHFLITVSAGTMELSTVTRLETMLSAVLPSVIVDLTNNERGKDNLVVLTRSSILDEAARLKALHMRENNYFEHYSPEGISPWHWFDEVGYDYIHAGENLAVFFKESEEVVEAWMDSPLHRENILKAEYSEIGVATVEATHKGYKTVFVVQLFGTPAPKTAVLQALDEREIPTTPADMANAVDSQRAPEKFPDESVFGVLDDTEIAKADNARTEESLVPMEQQVIERDTVPETTVEMATMEDTRVYLSDHIATGTMSIPATLHSTESRASQGKSGEHSLLGILYFFLSLLVGGMLVSSVLLAKVKQNIVQASYGTMLLLLLLSVVILNTHLT